jgi:hypothetical protein
MEGLRFASNMTNLQQRRQGRKTTSDNKMFTRGSFGVRAVVATIRWGSVLIVALGVNACGTAPTKAEDYGVLRAAGVVVVASANDFKEHKVLHDTYAAAGVAESEMVDGASIGARRQCCRPDMQNSGPVTLYNAQHLKIEVGDFVEFRVGGETTKDHKNELNVITRVLQHGEPADGECWWDPRNPNLWRRVVHCEWMQKQGWIWEDTIGDPGWYKPAAAQSP